MVVNKGFSFSNFVDQYELKTFCRGISEELKTEFSSIFTEDELYQHAEIVSICPANHLTEIYSTSSFNSDQSIAFEFSNIDIHDYSQVIAFCNKFGSIYSERLLRNNSEYEYIFMNRSKNEFAPAVATREFDTMFLSSFCESVVTMRTILNMISAINQNDYVSMLHSIIFLSFHSSDKMYSWIDTPSGMIYQDFRAHFISFNRLNHFIDQTLQEQINSYLVEIGNYLLYSESCPDNFDTDYDFIFSSFGQSQLSLFDKLKDIVTITKVSEEGTVEYDGPLSEETISANLDKELILQLTNAFISSMLNFDLRNVYPEIRFENNNLVGDWNVSTLYDAMVLEVFLTFSSSNRVKKCANPTCNSFFEVGVGNDRKIYCSTRCAQLMAKRKQRERDKKG